MAYFAVQNSDLEHHGVKGQKWGVRRKKTSVSVTPSSPSRTIKKAVKRSNVAAKKKYSSTYANRGKLSNEELKKNVDRLELENRLNAAVNNIPSSTKSKGSSAIAKYAGRIVNSKPVIGLAGAALATALRKYGPTIAKKVVKA